MTSMRNETIFGDLFSDSDDECASQLTFGGTFCENATFNDSENVHPNLTSTTSVAQPKKSSSEPDFPSRFTMCDPETQLGHCFLINNRYLKKNNEWVGHYRCSYHRDRECKNKAQILISNGKFEYIYDPKVPHTCGSNYEPKTKKSKTLPDGVIDVEDEVNSNLESMAKCQPKMSAKDVAYTVYKETENKYEGIMTILPTA